MGSKTIMVTEEAYNRLKAAKREDESFSEVLKRLLSERKPKLSDFAGAWKDVPEEKMKEFERWRELQREMSRKRMEELMEQCLSPIPPT